MQAYSPDVPVGIVAEVTDKGRVKKMSVKQIERGVIEGLINSQMIKSEDEIELVDSKYIPYTYPIPTLGINKIKVRLQKILEPYNFYLLGRNGNWDYINMDQVVKNCWDLFEKLDEKFI